MRRVSFAMSGVVRPANPVRGHWLASAYVVLVAAVALNAAGQPSVLTQHNDNGRTGQNTAEIILNTTNVNVNTFGKLFSLPVQGQVYAQPLYVPGVTVNGATHNVLIVATEADLVYAFDADSGGSPLWTASLIDSLHGANPGEGPAQISVALPGCTDLQPNVGITSTPVIDPVAGTIYVEAKSETSSSTYIHRLHALSLSTGAESSQGPVVITATVNGTGDGSSNGQLAFDSLHEHSRPGLLLQNGSIFIAFASQCDYSPYHGWLFAYNASTFAQESVFVTTPNGGLGGFWMSGAGVAADANGNIFISSGNGDFDTTNVPATELGDTVMKLGTSGGNFSLLDYFTPSDQNCLSSEDHDLGSGGVLVLPDQPGADPHILVAAGKEGMVYVVNRDQMTLGNNHFENSNNCNSSDPQILGESGSFGNVFSLPAYWNSTLYYWAAGDNLKSIPLVNGQPSFGQMKTGAAFMQFPGATPSITSNGTTSGTAILWAQNSYTDGAATVYAFDATNVNSELWDSTKAANKRDAADVGVKFAVPTVVNGKVYVGGNSSVTVYGLLQVTAALVTPAPGSVLSGSSASFSWTSGNAVTAYELWLGTTGVGSQDVYNSGQISSTSAAVTGLPTNGARLYARLWSLIAGKWRSNDYTYTESGSPTLAALTSPAPSSTLSGSNVTLSWTAGAGPTAYQLWLGNTGIGSANIFNSGAITTTSASVSNIPSNGLTIYARMWSQVSGAWRSIDYTYTESGTPALAALTSPAPGSILPGSSATFSWSAGSGPSAYELWLGTTGVGSSNVFNSGSLSTTSIVVNGIPANGVTLYARMWSRMNGAWQSVDYTYTEAGSPAPAVLSTPSPGSVLSGSSATFSWTSGSGPTAYELWLGTTGVGSSNVFNSGSLSTTSVSVNGIPTTGVTLYARIWSLISGRWQSIDYTYTESGTPVLAALTTPTPGSALSGASATFSWTAGSGPTAYELWLGTSGVGSSNVVNTGPLSTTSVTANSIPTNGVTLFARMWSYVSGRWQSIDYTYTESGSPTLAALTSPAPSSTLTGSSATFTWSAGAGPTAYQLWLGTTGVGSANIFNSGSLTATSDTVNSIPTTGAKLYARMWSYVSGKWQSVDYTYTTASQ